MPYCQLKPEVPGGFGAYTELNASVHPPIVRRLHFQFDGWLGDELVTTFPCYLVTDRLGEDIQKAGLTGCELDCVEVTTSEEFQELFPDLRLPRFLWLKIVGQAKSDDFGMSDEYLLVVSEKAMAILKNYALANCEVRPAN